MEIFDEIRVTDHAGTAQDEVVAYLESKGFKCIKEVYVNSRGDKMRGRIDIIAEKDGKTIAIEFDNKSPRKKSIVKLNRFDSDFKVILLRGGNKKYTENGIKVISVKLKGVA